jgi:hypothetical protein
MYSTGIYYLSIYVAHAFIIVRKFETIYDFYFQVRDLHDMFLLDVIKKVKNYHTII